MKIAAVVLALVVVVAVVAVIAMPRDISVEKEGDGALSFEGEKSLRAFGSIDIGIEPAEGCTAAVYLDGEKVASDVSSYRYDAPFADFSKHEIKVVFERTAPQPDDKMTLTVDAGEGGTVDPAGATEFEKGASVTLSIEPKDGYVIDDIKIDGTSVAVCNVIEVKMDADHSVSVSFRAAGADDLSVDIAVDAQIEIVTTGADLDFGKIVPSGVVKVRPGASLKIAVILNAGYEISDFKVDGKSVGKVTEYTIEDIRSSVDVSISVVKKVDGFTIKASAGTGGKITPSGDMKVEKGKDASFTFSANSGYAVSEVIVDGKKVVASGSYTFKNVSENHTIAVTFKYVGSGGGSGGGSITPPVTLKEIKVTTPPTKIVYKAGEKFDDAGMIVKAVYSNGTEKILNEYTIYPPEMATDTTAVMISYNGKTCEQTVVIVDDNTVIVETAEDLAKVGNELASNDTQGSYNNKIILITKNIDMSGKNWPAIDVIHPLEYLTIKGYGDGITISNLKLAENSFEKDGKTVYSSVGFIASTFSMESLIIQGITFDNLDTGVIEDHFNAIGAFIGFAEASTAITIADCNIMNSSISGGHWAGGFVGYAAGYSGTDGPVFETLTIEGCTIENSTISSSGSVGGFIGHAAGDAWTRDEFKNCSVTGSTITSTGTANNKAGSLMGTLGAGQTKNGKSGGVFVMDCTVTDNTVKSNDVLIDLICGRQGSPGGVLNIDGRYMAFWYGDGKEVIKEIQRIEVTKQPSTFIFDVDSRFDKTRMEITAYYTDGTSRVLNGTEGYKDEYICAPSILTKDTSEVEISFGGMTCAVKVIVVDDKNNAVIVDTADKLVEVGNGLSTNQSDYKGKTILIINDLDMSGKNWPAFVLNNNVGTLAFKGYGDGIIISNLVINEYSNDDSAKGSAGFVSYTGSMESLTFEGITFSGLSVNVTSNVCGVGAFIGCAGTSQTIAIKDCHIADSMITGGHWTGGFVGYAAGYSNQSNGPVFETLTIEGCTIKNSAVSSPGSAGGLIGHAAGDAWTRDEFKNCSVTGCTITCTEENADNKAGSLMGTIGEGQTKNGKFGGVFVTDCIATGNTVNSYETSIDRIYGRQGSTGGVLCVDGKLFAFKDSDLVKLTQDEYDSSLLGGKKIDAIVLVTAGEWDLGSSSLKNIVFEIPDDLTPTLKSIPANSGWTYRFYGDGYTGYGILQSATQYTSGGYFEVESAEGFKSINEGYDAINDKLQAFMSIKYGLQYLYSYDVKLVADLDFQNESMDTIDFRYASIDGKNDGSVFTVKNAIVSAIDTGKGKFGGFVSRVDKVSNISFENIHIICNVDNAFVGVAAGFSAGSSENVRISSSSITINANGCYAGGLFGDSYANMKNCSVDDVEISGGKNVGSLVGYVCNEKSASSLIISGNSVSNVTITATERAATTNAFCGRVNVEAGVIAISGTTISNIMVNSVKYDQVDLEQTDIKTPYGQLLIPAGNKITIDGTDAVASKQ